MDSNNDNMTTTTTTTTNTTPKIIDLINEPSETPKISLEFFPPRSPEGVENLYKRMDRMLEVVKPLFTDVTWGAGGSTAELSMTLAQYAHAHGHVANLHMTCTNMGGDRPKEYVLEQLQTARQCGIRNIVALRGDPPAGQDEWKAAEGGFACALDLVKYIKTHFGDYFGISVAGYPEGHPNAISQVASLDELTQRERARASCTSDGKVYVCKDQDYEKEMAYLKKKVDAGADFIITQMFFDVHVYIQFVQDCRDWGITCPIVPGLMCINAYPGFCKMTKFCKTRVPESLATQMEELKNDVAAMKQFGIDYGANMCRDILASGTTNVFHFYTLNLEKVVYGIMDNLGLTSDSLHKVNEGDAATQMAVGSAWARVGDVVTSVYGSGIVQEIRNDGSAVIEMDQWEMAGGQKPRAFLHKSSFSKA
jgi:methylenetetrahydrofolate reductase (NADPH)